MATGYIYNGFGNYDERDGKVGTIVKYAGEEYFLPFQEVSIFPNWTSRELDQNASTPEPDAGGPTELVYKVIVTPGDRMVAALCDGQLPVANRDMGLLPIRGKATGNMISVLAGVDSDGQRVYADVQEKEPTKAEMAEAAELAKAYKERVINEYFDSKRQRMTGGVGKLNPDKRTRAYMEELGVEDIDDIAKHTKQSGLSPEMLQVILEQMSKNATVTQEKIDKAVVKAGPTAKHAYRSQGLAEHAAEYDRKQAEKETANG